MTTKTQNENGTDPQRIGLVLSGHAKIAALLGTDTPETLETPELVADRYQLSLEVKRLERRLSEIDAILKAKTGERQVGAFWVKVTSSTRESVDVEAVREILGENTPVIKSATVRLSVVPA